MKNVIIHGDCLEVLRKMDDNSVDSVVTDPPYGLSKEPNISEVLTKWLAGEPYDHGHGGFMGKAWDSFVPHPDVWKEVYRVLKPGGHALVFAGTRTQDLMTISLRLGGFEIRDVIEWLSFSGFPKSMDVSKQFDKRRNDLDAVRTVCRFIRAAMDKKGLKSRDLTQHFGNCNPRLIDHWAARDTDSQPRTPTIEQYLKLKDVLDLSDEMDELVYKLNRRKGTPGEAWETREKVGEYQGDPGGFGELRFQTVNRDITASATDLAKKWDGWGTALKPAHEPIIVARKPLAGTVAETVEKYGTGAINIDGCRIEYATSEDFERVRAKTSFTEASKSIGFGTSDTIYGTGSTPLQQARQSANENGRFPANCITIEDSAFYSPYFNVGERLSAIGNVTPREVCKKASKADRGEGNTHPTVKPTDLMAWLVRLVTPPGGTTLDPFAGSGTTLVSGIREGFNVIGIEQAREYCDITAARTGLEIIEISEVGETSSRQTSEDTTKEVAYA